ncbi:MAG: MFS transporter, partial [Burkholderiales bacterium]|nr:MFS transporter [Burkholderiales bacterium]
MLKTILSNKIIQEFLRISFGNILEWYDFTIYGLLAIQLAQVFFPNNSKFTGLIMVFTTFAMGFLARPFGSLLFGRIGDKYGNHYAVTLSIWLMAISSGIICLLPSYQTIGIFAPLFLVLLRVCQGLSAGGQFSGLITIAINTTTKNTSFLVSLVHAIAIIGSLLASLIVYLDLNLFKNLLPSLAYIAWRIPFGISFILFIVYLWLN